MPRKKKPPTESQATQFVSNISEIINGADAATIRQVVSEFMSLMGGPRQLASQFKAMLDDPKMGGMVKAKLLQQINYMMAQVMKEGGAQDMQLLSDEDLLREFEVLNAKRGMDGPTETGPEPVRCEPPAEVAH